MPPSDAGPATNVPPSSLLVRLRQRDGAAWQGFLDLYGPLIYSWARSRWHLAPADAADLLQDVVGRVLEAIEGYRGGNFVAWLDAITRSQAADFFRKNPHRAAGGRDTLAQLPDPRGEPGEKALPTAIEGVPLSGVLGRAVERVRARAAPQSWQAFWQVTVLGRSPADVAHDLGLSTNAVYIANSRLLRRLRDELGEPG